jgi:hypothetical protein
VRQRTPTKNDLRTFQRTLLLLDRAGLVHRIKYLDLENDGVGYAGGLTDKAVQEYGGKTFDEHSHRTLDHELAITSFHIALEELSRENCLTLYWQQTGLKKGINPDAYFSITNLKKDGKSTNHFFLELERAKVGNVKDGVPSIMRKLAAYYAYYNSEQCRSDWSFATFRVVVVLPSELRRSNLLAALRVGYNHRMFWLGTGGAHFQTPPGDTYSFLDI